MVPVIDASLKDSSEINNNDRCDGLWMCASFPNFSPLQFPFTYWYQRLACSLATASLEAGSSSVQQFSAGLLWFELFALRAEGNSARLSISMERDSWGWGTEESVALQGLSSLPGHSTLRYHDSRGQRLTDIFLISQKLGA